MNDHVTISLYKILKKFPDNETVRKFLEQKRWGDTPTCPFCGFSRSVARSGRKIGFYRCNHCRKDYSVRTRSIFENSKVGLDKWLIAMYLMVTARKGISSLQLSRQTDSWQTSKMGHVIKEKENNLQQHTGSFRFKGNERTLQGVLQPRNYSYII